MAEDLYSSVLTGSTLMLDYPTSLVWHHEKVSTWKFRAAGAKSQPRSGLPFPLFNTYLGNKKILYYTYFSSYTYSPGIISVFLTGI